MIRHVTGLRYMPPWPADRSYRHFSNERGLTDREIALVLADLEPPGQAKLFGVVRASFEPDLGRAEFAIVIPRQLAGQGLGTRLMMHIIELTRTAGMGQIYGDTLPENKAMRALARKLGFHEELKDHLIRLTLSL